MAEKHKTYSHDGTSGDVIYSIFDFVVNQQSGVLRVASDSGGTKGVKYGGVFWNGSDTLTAASFSANNDYIVIEPVNEYPGGGRWQCRIIASDHDSGSASATKAMVSFGGGWHSSSDEDFGSVNKSDDSQIFVDTLNSADTLYISCSNDDAYTPTGGSEQTYTYFRCLNFDQSNDASASESTYRKTFQGLYVGGYLPADDNDTKPICILRGIAYQSNVTNYWGDVGHTNCVVPAAFDHNVTDGINSCHLPTQIGGTVASYAVNRSGQWCNEAQFLNDSDANVVLGHFGSSTMMRGATSRTRGSADSSSELINGHGLIFRWKI